MMIGCVLVVSAWVVLPVMASACHENVISNDEDISHKQIITYVPLVFLQPPDNACHSLSRYSLNFLSILGYGVGVACQPLREPTTDSYCSKKRNCREIITDLCDGYLIMVPKLMGCVVCQCAHLLAKTERFEHYDERKMQLEKLKDMVNQADFDVKAVLDYLNNVMSPFSGDYGKNFHRQCELQLHGLLKQWR